MYIYIVENVELSTYEAEREIMRPMIQTDNYADALKCLVRFIDMYSEDEWKEIVKSYKK